MIESQPKINWPTIYLLLIIFTAAILRVYNLGEVNNGFLADEAVNAYDAYSILRTGKNMWGESYPFFFNHHNVDSVSGLYVYSSIPFIYAFGLNEFSARFAAAIFGILTVFVTYLLTKRLFKNETVALVAAFFLAISPWHILFSRVALRGIMLPFFFVTGLLFLCKGHNKLKYSVLSGVVIGASFYTYAIARLFVPLFLVGYTCINRKDIYINKRNFLIFSSIVVLMAAPVFIFSMSEKGGQRIKDLSIFGKQNIEEARQSIEDSHGIKRKLAKLPEIFISGMIFVKNYLTFFTPKFLFSKWWNEYHLYWFEMPFLILGIYFLIKYRRPENLLLIWWFLIYCIPSSITVPGTVPHRAINGLPVFQIISAYGLYYCSKWIVPRFDKKIAFASLVFIISASVNIYICLHYYYKVYPKNTGEHWQFGFRDAIAYTESVKENYDQIIFSQNLHNAYALILFYTKYDPKTYLSNKKMRVFKTPQKMWLDLHVIDKYKIENVAQTYSQKSKNLYVTKPNEIKKNVHRRIIYYPNRKPAIEIIG